MEQNRIERAPTLGARLQKCADFVREGKKLADIGTDHGYVPVCLLQSGKIPFAVAVDVHKGPFRRREILNRHYSPSERRGLLWFAPKFYTRMNSVHKSTDACVFNG